MRDVIEVRPKSEFTSFRNHDIGEEGYLIRLVGRRSSGSWDTQAWPDNIKKARQAHRAGTAVKE
jgi:hypothetical protein